MTVILTCTDASLLVLAAPARPSFAKAKFTKSLAEKTRSGAPGGAGVVGHATRTDVATRPRFGRGARHRTIRLREPPASGALRLPALHHHRGSPPRLSTAAAQSSAPAPLAAGINNRRPYGERDEFAFIIGMFACCQV